MRRGLSMKGPPSKGLVAEVNSSMGMVGVSSYYCVAWIDAAATATLRVPLSMFGLAV